MSSNVVLSCSLLLSNMWLWIIGLVLFWRQVLIERLQVYNNSSCYSLYLPLCNSPLLAFLVVNDHQTTLFVADILLGYLMYKSTHTINACLVSHSSYFAGMSRRLDPSHLVLSSFSLSSMPLLIFESAQVCLPLQYFGINSNKCFTKGYKTGLLWKVKAIPPRFEFFLRRRFKISASKSGLRNTFQRRFAKGVWLPQRL